jgi:DNA-binding response OmpR family regulator
LNALIVEDNPHMRLLLSELLRQFGAERIASAANVSEARNHLDVHSFDLGLVDVGLDGESGLDLIRGLRLEPRSRHRRMPILVVSGQSQRATIEAARDAGADGFLVKPVSDAALRSRIKRLITEPCAYVEAPTFFGPDRRRRHDPNYRGPERRGVQDDTFEIE